MIERVTAIKETIRRAIKSDDWDGNYPALGEADKRSAVATLAEEISEGVRTSLQVRTPLPAPVHN